MTNTTAHQAIVIGCGIGGPVAAMALQQAGIDAAIYEAFDRPADYVGSFLNLASNGIDALRAIDADRPVLAAGFATPRILMWSGTGRRLGEVANGIALSDGTTSQTIQRGLLHRALRDQAVRRGIPIFPGKRVASAELTPAGVLAHFEDGSTATAEMLIGADGLNSRIRHVVDASAPAPRFTGLLSLGARAVSTTLPPTPETFHMMFGSRAFFGYTVRPCGEIYWFANVASTIDPTGEPRAAVSSGAWKAQLINLFETDRGPAAEIVRNTGEDVAAYPVFDLPTVPTWRKGPIVIIGDAAHATSPSSGQGASLAIEDAVILAQCLRDANNLPEGLERYEQRRRERVQRVVAYAARIGSTKTVGPIGRWIRDLLMPVALRYVANPQAQAWLYGHHIDWSDRAGPFSTSAN